MQNKLYEESPEHQEMVKSMFYNEMLRIEQCIHLQKTYNKYFDIELVYDFKKIDNGVWEVILPHLDVLKSIDIQSKLITNVKLIYNEKVIFVGNIYVPLPITGIPFAALNNSKHKFSIEVQCPDPGPRYTKLIYRILPIDQIRIIQQKEHELFDFYIWGGKIQDHKRNMCVIC